jgi:formylglycine-generating enzyme required for sulfatase activity
MIGIFVILLLAGVAGVYFLRRTYTLSPPTVAAQPAPPKQPAPTPPIAVAKALPPTPAPAKAKAPLLPAVVKAGTVRVNKKDGQKYVWIPPGDFTMGCVPNDSACGAFAKPSHRVTISAGFWMAQTSTTVAAYKLSVSEMPKAPKFNPDWTLTDHPMIEVNWDDATAYCTRAGGRLPTEAEWEYAARGGVADTLFPWGNDASHDFANFGEGTNGADERGSILGKDQWMNTSPVASFAPNGFHLYDMIGNVSQWCSDWFSPSYYGSSPEKDPRGPETGTLRIARGSSWKSPPRFTHTSIRGSRKPDERGLTTGFRCVANTLP